MTEEEFSAGRVILNNRLQNAHAALVDHYVVHAMGMSHWEREGWLKQASVEAAELEAAYFSAPEDDLNDSLVEAVMHKSRIEQAKQRMGSGW